MKAKPFLLAIAVLFTIGAGDASAILNIAVNANPYIGGYDPYTSISGTVEYRVTHEGLSNEALSFLQLQFDSSIFTSFSLVSALLDGTTNVSGSFSSSGDKLRGLGLSMAPGSSLVLRVSYSLAGPAASLFWPESWPGGLPEWSQGWVAASSGFSFDGGSTGLAPEPGTVLLLGTGLLSLGIVNRIRQRRKMLS